MRVVKFSKEYIMREFKDVMNAEKVHAMIHNTDKTYCGMHNEISEEFEGKTNCPNCIDFIEKVKELQKGKDY